jgi:two-component system cell cycle sensor histidine kinase/response regulator CckA
MPVMPLRVLLVEDDDAYAGLIAHELSSSPVCLDRVRSLSDAQHQLRGTAYNAILLDLDLPDSKGIDTVESLYASEPDVPIVVLTSHADATLPAAAMQHGAQDYLLKDTSDAATITRALRYARERADFRRSLRERDSKLRALIENSYDAVTLVSADYNILYDSAAIERITGFTPEERLGRNVGEFLHPDDAPALAERFAYSLQHPDELLRLDFRYLHKDGGYRWGQAVGVNRLGDPAVAAIVVNHRDVTEHRSMETALRASEEELRHAQKLGAVGRLAGGVAHDFNNVLTAIFGYTDLLLEQFAPSDVRRADVQEIRRSAERAASLTRQLLVFSRKQVLQPRDLDLNGVISSLEKLLGRLVGDDIQLSVTLQPGLHKVHADAGQIEQVLMNLVANARDSMLEGGTVRISTTNVTVDDHSPLHPALPRGDYARLAVEDEGTGMSASVREHVFEPFFTTKAEEKGTGLGLATVESIVKGSGGGIYVEDSVTGQGTTFAVYLPRATATSSP